MDLAGRHVLRLLGADEVARAVVNRRRRDRGSVVLPHRARGMWQARMER